MKKVISMVSVLLTLSMNSTPVFASEKVENLISHMSLDEKIGQMILIGFRGTSIEESESLKYDLEKVKVGSVILFDYDAKLKIRGRNISSPEQVKKLNRDIQKHAKIPVFISVDEEGGMVSRLKERYGFTAKKSAMELGKSSLEEAIPTMNHLASELKENHFNMNFAPLVDVNVNPDNPVIGKVKRSFSENEEVVADFAEQMVEIQNSKNIVSVLKHFPGHGSSTSDSHLGLVDVTESWESRELFPYQKLIIDNKVDMIMSAHVYQRHLDPEYPATLSQIVLTGLLREKLGFRGVTISDDMNMGAIRDHFGREDAYLLAINAGIDILLIGNNIEYDKNAAKFALEVVRRYVKEGKISEKRIEESVRRILILKEKFGLI